MNGWYYVTVDVMWCFWAAKWDTTLFGETCLKDLFSDDYDGQAGEGRLLWGQSRENFEMIDETWRAHTDADTISNFQKPLLEQDPFFGNNARP